MVRRSWTEEETTLAFNLYCKIPFYKIHYTNSVIIELANIIKRSPSSVALRLVNFASLDPELRKRNIRGMSHSSKQDLLIWKKFNSNWEELVFKSEKILAEYKKENIENSACIDISNLPKEGRERERIVRTRVNQSFFRKTILASYDNCCSITGISIPELLVASHIIPWAEDKKNRMNPCNGICLNALHDKAFDCGLLTITTNYKLKLSSIILKKANSEYVEKYFLPYEGIFIRLPQKFVPENTFLEYHNKKIFIDE